MSEKLSTGKEINFDFDSISAESKGHGTLWTGYDQKKAVYGENFDWLDEDEILTVEEFNEIADILIARIEEAKKIYAGEGSESD